MSSLNTWTDSKGGTKNTSRPLPLSKEKGKSWLRWRFLCPIFVWFSEWTCVLDVLLLNYNLRDENRSFCVPDHLTGTLKNLIFDRLFWCSCPLWKNDGRTICGRERGSGLYWTSEPATDDPTVTTSPDSFLLSTFRIIWRLSPTVDGILPTSGGVAEKEMDGWPGTWPDSQTCPSPSALLETCRKGRSPRYLRSQSVPDRPL